MEHRTISSLPEFLGELQKIQRIDYYGHSISCRTFFRGQANNSWRLSPRLYREGLFHSEGLLVKRLLHLNPVEFGKNRFENLAKMQHFGLPTRLLDCTTNPLVVLYFACADISQVDKDGCVFVFPNLPTYWCTDPLIEVHIDYIFDHGYPNRVPVEQYHRFIKEKYAHTSAWQVVESIQSLLNWYKVPMLTIIPRMNTQRLINQDGAFFLFGMDSSLSPSLHGRQTDNLYDYSCSDSKNIHELWGSGFSIEIPSSAKQDLLGQLDILGINSERLFPDLDHQTEYVLSTIQRSVLKQLCIK